jgi:hypothetical protein
MLEQITSEVRSVSLESDMLEQRRRDLIRFKIEKNAWDGIAWVGDDGSFRYSNEKRRWKNVIYKCGYCTYFTARKIDIGRHLKRGCPVERKLEKKQKKERHREVYREYKQRKAQEAGKKIAHLGFMEPRAAEERCQALSNSL